MATIVPGYQFTGPDDPITAAKLNLLGSPTLTVGTIDPDDLAPQPGTGYLMGSTPASDETTSMRINSTGLTLHTGTGLTFGSASENSGIAIGQSTTARSFLRWGWNASEASANFSLLGSFGDTDEVTGFIFSNSTVSSFVAGVGTWTWTALGSLYNADASASMATSATDGYFYVPTTSGTPTGVPAFSSAGRTGMVFDRAGKALYCYDDVDDAWISVTLS
jgi:hypothetical protein